MDDLNWKAAYRGTLDFIARSRHCYLMLTTRKCHPTCWNGVMLFQRIG